MLLELERKERVSQLRALSESQEAQETEMFRDYYEGIHFVKRSITNTDYSKSSIYQIETRSGYPLYDDYTEENKILVKTNWCKPVVDTVADYTRGVNEDIIVETEDEDITKIWDENSINTITHEGAYEAGISGKYYLRIKRKEKGKPIQIIIIPRDMVYQNINKLTDEVESVIYYFELSKQEAKALYPDVAISGDDDGVVFYAEEWSDKRVEKYIDGIHINPEKYLNPYDFIPFIEVKGNVNSTSDISDVLSLNDGLNIILTYINEILKYQAFPMLAPKGNYSSDFPVLNKEILKDVEISPRTILPIPMERIAGGGIDDSILKYIEQVEKDISIVSGVPIKLLTAEIDGNTSGVALQRMMGNVVKQAEIRRNYIREAYKQTNKLLFKLLGKKEQETDIIFPEIIKMDLLDKLDEGLKKQSLGISKDTVLSELGYDYEEEEEKRGKELDNSLETRITDEFQAIQQTTSRKQKEGADNKQKLVK